MLEGRHRALANMPILYSFMILAIFGNPLTGRMTLAAVLLTHGPLTGAVKPSQAKIWVRTSTSATIQVEYSTSIDFINSRFSNDVLTSQQKDWTAMIQLSELSQETIYFYRLLINGSILPIVYRLKTAPPLSTRRSFSFAVLSDFRNSVAPLYKSVSVDDPAFVIFLGDFSHREPTTLSEMRDMHRTLRGPETPAGRDFISYIRKFPFYHVWDDHDLGKNNADKTFPGMKNALRAFREYFPTTALSGPDGIWHKFRYAQAEFFMLDLRSQRDPNSITDGLNKSILGKEQKEWVKNGLLHSSATWKFILSTVPFNPGSKPNDSWAGFQVERSEIVDFITINEISNVIFISGDLHSGGALDNGLNSEFPELSVPHANIPPCTTPTSCKCHTAGDNPGTWSEGLLCGLNNPGYGFITVRHESVTLEAKGDDGSIRLSIDVQEY